MTEQSKITKKSGRAASILERADAAFGLDRMGTAKVPHELPVDRRPANKARVPMQAAPGIERRAQPQPRVERRAQPPMHPQMDRRASAQPAMYPAQPPQARPVKTEPAVRLSGPRVQIEPMVLRDAGLIVPEEPVTGLLEEFRIIKRELLADARANGEDAARRILVCSPHQGEGKTYCAMNLAIALAAESDIEVVLVDADVLNPSIAKRFEIETEAGFMDVLADKSLKPENLVSPTDINGLFVLPAGTSSARDAEFLTSKRTEEVLDRLTRGAPNRYLIFDTPPALAASPAAELAAYVGQALLVARADETGKAALEDARQLLSACPDIKLLLNAAQFSPSGRRFGDYGEKGE